MNTEVLSIAHISQIMLLFVGLLFFTALRTIIVSIKLQRVGGVSKTLPMFAIGIVCFLTLNLVKQNGFLLQANVMVLAIICGIALAGGWYAIFQAISKEELSVVSPLQSLSVLFVGIFSPFVMAYYEIELSYTTSVQIGCGLILLGMCIQYLVEYRKKDNSASMLAYWHVIIGAGLLAIYMMSLSLANVVEPGFNKEMFLVWAELTAVVILVSYAYAQKQLYQVLQDFKTHSWPLLCIGLATAMVAYIEVHLIMLVPAVIVTASKRGTILIETLISVYLDKVPIKKASTRVFIATLMLSGAIVALTGDYWIPAT